MGMLWESTDDSMRNKCYPVSAYSAMDDPLPKPSHQTDTPSSIVIQLLTSTITRSYCYIDILARITSNEIQNLTTI